MTTIEKRPRGAGWVQLRYSTPAAPGRIAESWWASGTLRVGSELVDTELPNGSGNGPQWLVSVSDSGGRPGRTALRRALKAFGMVRSEEDNHHPGVARHYWLPVDPAQRVDCQCKTDETVVVEPDGYRWTNPVDGPCRGCELTGITGAPCTLHRPALDAGGAR